MIICYIDESGTPNIPGNTSHYVLAGLAIAIDKWKYCEKKVNEIKKKYHLEGAEIHTGWILRLYLEQSRIGNFEKLDTATRRYEVEKYRKAELLRLQSNPTKQKQYHRTKKNYKQTESYIHLTFDERRQFATEIAKMIGSWSFSRLFAEGIDKIYFNPTAASSSIDEQAFEQVVSRFEQYLKIYSKTTGEKKFGLLVHDNNPTVCKKHTQMMKSFHRVGTLWTSIRNLIETPLFVDSQLTSMVQLADLCCYSIRRYLEKNEDFLFKEIFKRADSKGSRIVGVRHFSDNTCRCDICQSH